MNSSERRINQEVKAMLQSPIVEPAFKGTVLEGKERKYTIINEHDLHKYIDMSTRQDLAIVLDKVLGNIENSDNRRILKT